MFVIRVNVSQIHPTLSTGFIFRREFMQLFKDQTIKLMANVIISCNWFPGVNNGADGSDCCTERD